MSARSPYDLLQVSPTAQAAVIEAAYRALMKRHHPDQAGAAGDAALAAEINHAYHAVRSPERRADTDRRLDAERRERAHATQARLAAMHQPGPPPRRVNLFGWSGWLVAIGVAAVALNLDQPRPTTAVALPTARADPSEMLDEGVSQPDPATLDAADAELGRSIPQVQASEPPSTAARVAPTPAPRPRAQPRPAPPQRRVAREQPPAQPSRDFLEREGYIY